MASSSFATNVLFISAANANSSWLMPSAARRALSSDASAFSKAGCWKERTQRISLRRCLYAPAFMVQNNASNCPVGGAAGRGRSRPLVLSAASFSETHFSHGNNVQAIAVPNHSAYPIAGIGAAPDSSISCPAKFFCFSHRAPSAGTPCRCRRFRRRVGRQLRCLPLHALAHRARPRLSFCGNP